MSRQIPIGGQTFEIRALKRKEIRKLTEEGFNYGRLSPDTAEQAMDRLLELSCPGQMEKIDELDNKDAYRLFREAIADTFGSAVEIKNCSTSGDGTTAAAQTTAQPA